MLQQFIRLPRTIHILCLGTMINRAGSFVLIFLALYLNNELKLGASFATYALSAFGVGSLGAAIVGGHMADRIGRKTVMVFSLIGGATILLLFPWLENRWSIILAVLAFSFVMDMYRPAASAMIADVSEPETRPHAFGLMYIAINLGFSFAPFVGGWLAKFSYRWLFWGDAATSATYGLIILFTIRESLPRLSPAGPMEPSDRAGLPSSRGTHTTQIPLLTALTRIAKDGTFVMFCLASLGLACVFQQAFTTFPLYLNELGIDAATYGRIIAINGIMIVILQVPFTTWMSRFDRAAVLVAAAVVVGLGFGLKSFVTSPWLFGLTVAVWTCGEMMDAPVKFAVAADLAPVELRARYMGVMQLTFSAALAIGATTGGLVLEHFGGRTLWYASFVLGLVSAGLYASNYRRLSSRSHPVRSKQDAGDR